jgi:hypothetical protein
MHKRGWILLVVFLLTTMPTARSLATSIEAPTVAAPLEVVDDLRLGAPTAVGGALVYGVYREAWPDSIYLTLSEAAGNDWVELRELESAEVNTVELAWNVAEPLVILAGQMIRGAWQDRVVARDILLTGSGSGPLPVYCVEAGRWAGEAEFAVDGKLAANDVRAPVNAQSDQGEVWAKVARVQERTGTMSSTSAYRVVMESEAVVELTEELEEVFAELADDGACGVLVLGDGLLVGVDTFINPGLFGKLASEVAAAYAPAAATLEADEVAHPEPGKLAAEYLRKLAELTWTRRDGDGVSAGQFYVLESEDLTGGMLGQGREPVHLFATTVREGDSPSSRSNLQVPQNQVLER